MRIAISRHGLVVAALWAAFLYLLFLALAFAPKSIMAGEPPQALVARLVRGDDPTVESWQVLTDLDAPPGSEAGPTTSPNCNIQAMIRVPEWLREHMPGWEIQEWRCIPVAEVRRFLSEHRGANI